MQRMPEPEAMDIVEEADAYAKADFATVNAAFVNRLLYLAGARENCLCLDLGTGPGDIPIRVIRQGVSWRIIGADISRPMLRYAIRDSHSAGFHWATNFVCTDAKNMPFPDGAFDVIFSNSIIHHISDMKPFWREIRRIGKPGAFVLLRDLARPDTAEAAKSIVDRYAGDESAALQEEYYRSLLAAYTPDELRQQIGSAELHLLRVEMVSDRHLDIFGRLPL